MTAINQMSSKIYLLLIMLQLPNCQDEPSNLKLDAYKASVEYIVNSQVAQNYASEIYGNTKIHPYISPELIAFNTVSVAEDVIKEDYIEGYSIHITRINSIQYCICS